MQLIFIGPLTHPRDTTMSNKLLAPSKQTVWSSKASSVREGHCCPLGLHQHQSEVYCFTGQIFFIELANAVS